MRKRMYLKHLPLLKGSRGSESRAFTCDGQLLALMCPCQVYIDLGIVSISINNFVFYGVVSLAHSLSTWPLRTVLCTDWICGFQCCVAFHMSALAAWYLCTLVMNPTTGPVCTPTALSGTVSDLSPQCPSRSILQGVRCACN